MLLRILYHIGLLEYEGKFPKSHKLTPRFWQTLELRRDARIRAAFRIQALEEQLAKLIEFNPSDRRSRFRS